MKREDLEKLLGGYATGTLTDEERRALFDAALTDQALFDALAGEEALREVLEDPRCRRQIEQALREQPHGFLESAAGWMRRPRAWALAGTLAATAAIAFIVIHTERQPRVEIQLAQRQKVEAPAPMPAAPPPPAKSERRMADKLPAPERKTQAPAPTGVVGGAMPSQPPALAPAEPPAVAESRGAPVPPVPPPPPPKALSERAAAADTSTDASTGTAGAPVQFQANRVETPPAARQDVPAPALMQVRYYVLVKAPDGQFIQADPQAPVAPGIPIRLVLTANQQGNLAVFDSGRNLLFSTNAIAGARYTLDPPPADRKFTAVLTPTFPAARTSAPTALRESVEKGKLPGGRVITVIDLTRPRN